MEKLNFTVLVFVTIRKYSIPFLEIPASHPIQQVWRAMGISMFSGGEKTRPSPLRIYK